MAKKKEAVIDTTKKQATDKEKQAILEESVSIHKIEETIKEKNNLPSEEIEKINKYLFQNVMVAICMIVYFIFLNLGQINIQKEVYLTDLKVFSVCVLLLAIALIEKAYKQDDGKIAIYGIEMIVLSLITLALIYVNLMQEARYSYIVTAISYVFAIYYLIKSIVIYIKRRKQYFLENMKEMIQDNEE